MTRRAWLAIPMVGAAASALAVAPNFRVYLDEYPAPLARIVGAVDAGPAPMSTLGFADGVALEAASAWDFSSLTGQDVVLQVAPVADAWSCYVPDPSNPPPCGFDLPGNDLLIVRDNLATGSRGAIALDFDGTSRFLERAQVINESELDGVGDETRLCFNPVAHPELPYLEFQHPDGARQYMAAGDAWQSVVFSCNTDPLNVTSGSPCPGFAGGRSGSFDDGNGTLGRATGRVVRAGTITLPSGHVVDALMVELLASFNVRLACFIDVSRLRLYQVAWLVPHHGFLAQASSPTDTASLSAWTLAESTSIGYGLLPPLDVTLVPGPGTIRVTWDPGRFPQFADEWVVRWDVQPGDASAMAFSSEGAGDVIPSAQTGYTIRGLLPDTAYFVTVTAKKAYLDPIARVETTYHSIAPPTFVGADVDGDGTQDTRYPVVRSARTLLVTDDMAINESVMIGSGTVAPPVATVFAAACAAAPHALCADRTVPGALPMTLVGEALPTGSDHVTFYEHSDATQTMRLARSGQDLRATP